jgi:hypothetical protein
VFSMGVEFSLTIPFICASADDVRRIGRLKRLVRCAALHFGGFPELADFVRPLALCWWRLTKSFALVPTVIYRRSG